MSRLKLDDNYHFSSSNLVEIEREISSLPKKVTLTGNDLTLQEIIAVTQFNSEVLITPDKKIRKRIKECYEQMLESIRQGVPTYGCNTGYGGQAARVLNEGTSQQRIAQAKKISRAITHTDVSVGPLFSPEIVRAAMLIRINMLLKGVSGVRLEDLEIYCLMLNKKVTPLVNQYGGIGASGDLAHNMRVLNAARQIPKTLVWDEKMRVGEAKQVLAKKNIPPLKLQPKAGLAFVNGDNFSTAAAALISWKTLQNIIINDVVGAMVIEVLRGSDRSFHPLLSILRPHSGQKEIAKVYRYLLKDSRLAFQEMKGHKPRARGLKVQDGYSLRGLSQFNAVDREKLKLALKTIEINANSVSDNPLWVPPEFVTKGEKAWQWVSGGNFLASHMAEILDDLRKTMTRYIKLNDRHLARIIDTNENSGLPANLSDPAAISQCSFKGLQIQTGMFEVYSMVLSMPVTTLFGVHEERNQDITAHSLTSAILAWQNLDLWKYSLATNLLAVCQGVDLRGGPKLLSKRTKPVYDFIRKRAAYVEEERPLYHDLESVAETIKDGSLIKLIREEVFGDFNG